VVSSKKTPSAVQCRFIQLPYLIRRRIYHEAGLVSGETIHIRSNPKYIKHRFDPHENSHFTAFPLSLFAVCRIIHNEVTKIFYGETCFAVSRRAPRGLRILERFSESTLVEIKFLIVWINLQSCDTLCCGQRKRNCGNVYVHCSQPTNHDEPLTHTSISDQAIIFQWQRICSMLLRSVFPGQLKLYIICDCEDLQTAKMITEPLTMLPSLRDAALRFRRDHDKRIQILAENTILRLTNRPRNSRGPIPILRPPSRDPAPEPSVYRPGNIFRYYLQF